MEWASASAWLNAQHTNAHPMACFTNEKNGCQQSSIEARCFVSPLLTSLLRRWASKNFTRLHKVVNGRKIPDEVHDVIKILIR